MKLTKNFNKSEFECKCGCEMPEAVLLEVTRLANELQHIRDFIHKPMNLTNAYRCPEHNKEVGGVSNSQHILGKAADIQIEELEPFVELVEDGEATRWTHVRKLISSMEFSANPGRNVKAFVKDRNTNINILNFPNEKILEIENFSTVDFRRYGNLNLYMYLEISGGAHSIFNNSPDLSEDSSSR